MLSFKALLNIKLIAKSNEVLNYIDSTAQKMNHVLHRVIYVFFGIVMPSESSKRKDTETWLRG